MNIAGSEILAEGCAHIQAMEVGAGQRGWNLWVGPGCDGKAVQWAWGLSSGMTFQL